LTKKELLKALSDWPEDAEVELSILLPRDGEPVWYEISGVEEVKTTEVRGNENLHCLIYGDRIVME